MLENRFETSRLHNTSTPLCSVVISTYNRASFLRNTLQSLARQTYHDFEVIVVCGPCTDETKSVLAAYSERLRVISCPIKNLSVSRNLGIEAAAGDIVAFIDDDAIATPRWLEELVAGYVSDDIGGVGGVVIDHTGRSYQYKYSLCNRLGRTDFGKVPPFDSNVGPGANPFIYLQGTNASFRRERLIEIGGFNEQIAYYHDETDVCLRIIDSGYRLSALDGAAVFHKYAPSEIRSVNRVVCDPYDTVRSAHIFALQNGPSHYSNADIYNEMKYFLDEVQNGGRYNFQAGIFTRMQLESYRRRAEEGARDGHLIGGQSPARRAFSKPEAANFLPFIGRPLSSRPLRIAFVSSEYPPGEYGGIGRFTFDLANGFAAAGHDVHVVTGAKSNSTTDFEDGVWVHRAACEPSLIPAGCSDSVLSSNCELIARVYKELLRLHTLEPLDLVSAPLWNCEGALAACDQRFPTVITLMTSLNTVSKIHPSWSKSEHIRQLILLEGESFQSHHYVHAISSAILDKTQADYGQGGRTKEVIHLGVADQTATVQRRRADDGRIRLLFVGRLERRKGVDLLLDAAGALLRKFTNLEFYLVGNDTPHTELAGRTYREDFLSQHGSNADIRDRVVFAGRASDHELAQYYADADIFCLPSRYESYGLVLVEAMSFGLPCVTTKAGGMAEIVENDVTGIVVEPEDMLALANGLARLVTDEGLRDQMGKAARKRFLEKFSISATIPRTIRFYTEIADAHKERVGCQIGDVASKFGSMLCSATGLPSSTTTAWAQEIVHRASVASKRAWAPVVTSAVRSEGPAELHGLEKALRVRKFLTQLGASIGKNRKRLKAVYLTTHQLNERFARLEASLGSVDWRAGHSAGRIEEIVFKLSALLQQVDRNITQLQDPRIDEIEAKISALSERLDRTLQHISPASDVQVAEKISDLNKRLEFVRSEIMFEMRVLCNVGATGVNQRLAKLTNQPTIKSAEKLRAQEIRLNIGCGHIPLADYVNVDQRDLPGVDIVADALAIPVDVGSIAEIYSSHLLEHFSVEDLRRGVLPYWKGLLKPGGCIRAVVPDAERMLEGLQLGEMSFDDFRTVTYGLQEYDGDFHFNMFSRDSLRKLLSDVGFENVSYSFIGRRNGICFDMEIQAINPTS
jgi:glycogen synthase